MSVLGLVVVLDPSDPSALTRLEAVPGLVTGPRNGSRQAAVLEVPEHEVRCVLDALSNSPGVLSVAPVFHAPEPSDRTPCTEGSCR